MCFCCYFAEIYDFDLVYRYFFIKELNKYNNKIMGQSNIVKQYPMQKIDCSHFCNISQYFIENFPKAQLCKPHIK